MAEQNALPVSSLFNGVSQQPPSLRLPNQLETCQNVAFNVRDGATKRPGTWIERHLPGGLSEAGARLHPIVRSKTERYYVVYGEGYFRVFACGGPEAHVTISAEAQTYLNSFPAVPNRLRLHTASDTTFIVNKVVPTHRVELAGLVAGITAASAAVVESAGHGLTTGDVAVLDNTDSTPPVDGPHEVTVIDADHFSVPVLTTVAGTGVGSWSHGKIDPLSMPIRMIRTAIGTDVIPAEFDVDVIDWNQRQDGDAETNPAPRLIRDGLPIADVIVAHERFGFAGTDRIQFSQAGDLYNFYKEVAINTVESDPIAIQVGSGESSDVDFLVGVRKAVLVYTLGGQQYELGSDDVWTQSKVRLTPTIKREFISERPLVIDTRVFFASEAENAVQVHEYLYDEVSLTSQATTVTSHVPTWISLKSGANTARPIAFACCPDTLTVLVGVSTFDAEGDRLSGVDIFPYQMAFLENRKVQSAWSQWVWSPSTPDDGWAFWHFTIIGDTLYLLVSHKPDGSDTLSWKIEAMPLAYGADSTFVRDPIGDGGGGTPDAYRSRSRMLWIMGLDKTPGLPGTAGFGGGSSEAVQPPGNPPNTKRGSVAASGGIGWSEH